MSVFPLSPIEILWANLITSSFLAIGLGLEEASADVMHRKPRSLKAGVFTSELIIDKFIYGTFMGCLCLASYAIVVFGVGDGDLGVDCNENHNQSCEHCIISTRYQSLLTFEGDLAYRARGTVYSILTVLLSTMVLIFHLATTILAPLLTLFSRPWKQSISNLGCSICTLQGSSAQSRLIDSSSSLFWLESLPRSRSSISRS